MKWDGEVRCDVCGALQSKNWYDCRTTSGRWAFLCDKCFEIYGIGIGTGRGQVYNGLTLEKIDG